MFVLLVSPGLQLFLKCSAAFILLESLTVTVCYTICRCLFLNLLELFPHECHLKMFSFRAILLQLDDVHKQNVIKNVLLAICKGNLHLLLLNVAQENGITGIQRR